MRKKFSIFAAFSSLSFLLFGLAQAADIDVSIPGVPAAQNNPGAWVGGLYQFSLMAAGLLAFGMIVYAGLRYTFAAGNPSTQSDARDQILQALLGVLLLLGAYIVLFTINPNLINLQLPGLRKIEQQPLPVQSTIQEVQNVQGASRPYSARADADKNCGGGVVYEETSFFFCISKDSISKQKLPDYQNWTPAQLAEDKKQCGGQKTCDELACGKAGGKTVSIGVDIFCNKPYK